MDGQNRDSGVASGHDGSSPNQGVDQHAPQIIQPGQSNAAPQNQPAPPAPLPTPTANGELPEPVPSGPVTSENSAPAPATVDNTDDDDKPEPEQPSEESPEQPPQQTSHQSDNELTWNASEFIAHPKSSKWYAGLLGITIVAVALGYFITRDWVTVVVIAISGGLFAYMAGRQPRELDYGLSTSGVSVGPKFYPYGDFKSFTIIDDGPFPCIDFMPLKRFATVLTVYYDPKLEDDILDILADHLPFSKHERSATDNLMHRIRF